MDFQKSHIISYNTYRRIAKKHYIKDKTSSGKPVTYKKLRNRIQNHKNLQKKKQTIGIMSLCGCHPAISVRQEAVLLHRVEHDS